MATKFYPELPYKEESDMAGTDTLVDDVERSIVDRLQSIFEEGLCSEDCLDEFTIQELAAGLKKIKGSVEGLGKQKTELQKIYDYLSIEVIPDRMDEEDVTSMKITGVGRLQTRGDIRCTVPAKNKEALQQWLIDHNHGSMIAPTVNASSLKAFVREMMKEGKEYPEDLLKIHLYSRASVVTG